MDLIKDNENLEEFLTYIGSLLNKMDTFVNDTLRHDQLSGYAALKHMELSESLKFVKSYFKTENFSPPTSPVKKIEDRQPHKTNGYTKPEMDDTSDTNNNQGEMTTSDELQTKDTGCCCDHGDIIKLSKKLDVSAARLTHFSRNLQERISESQGERFPSHLHDFIIQEHSGWLNVDDEHKFYGVISDCCFCLFENEQLSSPSLMTLILNNTHSQPLQTRHDRQFIPRRMFGNAFTITLAEDDLYFYTDNAHERSAWIKWLNLASQYPFEQLKSAADNGSQRMTETCCQTEDYPTHDPGSTPKMNGHTDEDTTDHFPGPDRELPANTVLVDGTQVVMRRGTDMSRSTAYKTPPAHTNQSLRRSQIHDSVYDWGQDQGTTRRYASSQQLREELKLRKSMSFCEGVPNGHSAKPTSPRHGDPGYIITNGQINGKESLSSNSTSQASQDSVNRAKRSSSIMKRASSLFSLKSGGFQLGSTPTEDVVDTGTPPATPATQPRKKKGSSSILPTSHQRVDMSAMCEMQGFLLCKKLLKWASCYCCVYNGILSSFKDSESSLPEIQCELRKCRIIPVDEKKAKRPFAFKLLTPSKSMYFAAISDVDLDSWYTVFNEYCKGALALSMHRGGAYAMWQWNGDRYNNADIISNHIASIYNSSIYEDESGSDEDTILSQSDGSFSDHTEELTKSLSDKQSYADVRTPETGRSDRSYKSEGNNSDIISDAQKSDMQSHKDIETEADTHHSYSTDQPTTDPLVTGTSADIGPPDNTGHFEPTSPDGGRVMRSVSESDYRRHRLHTNGYLSRLQGLTRSTNDLPGRLASSTSSSSADELSSDETEGAQQTSQRAAYKQKKKMTQEDQRKQLLSKMMREKERIEEALKQKERREQENFEMEMLVNMTQLQQRRTSTQLKYDFLEKQLHDKREDKPKHTGLFAKPGKLEKGGSKSSSLDLTDSAESSQHIRREMEELKTKLDELDKGLVKTKSQHTSSLSKVLNNNKPAVLSSSDHSTSTRPLISTQGKSSSTLSEHKLKGLESIIETLDNKPKGDIGTAECNMTVEKFGRIRFVDDSPPEIRPETLALISEFETMTNGLMSRRSSIKYDAS